MAIDTGNGRETKGRAGKILMVGPALNALGGISRVASIYRDSGLFREHNIKYIPTSTDEDRNRTFFLFKNIFLFIKILSRNKVEAVYIHSSSKQSFLRKTIFLCITLIFRKKLIFHIHPTHFYDFLMGLSGISRGISLYLLKKATVIVVLTNFMKSNISEMLPDKKIFVLRNPIDINLFGKHPFENRNTDDLLYLGWFIREKGVYDLVDAVEILINRGLELKLHLFGTKQREKLVRYVSCRSLDHSVIVGNWIEDEAKLKRLYNSTMLILPSYSEGIPNVILEAMATGTPILSTPVGGLSEVLEDGYNAVITSPGNPEKLSDDIERLLKDIDLRKKIASNAYNDIKEKYDISIIKERFREIISFCLD